MRIPKLKKVNLLKVKTREVDGGTSPPYVLFLHTHTTIPTADSTNNRHKVPSHMLTHGRLSRNLLIKIYFGFIAHKPSQYIYIFLKPGKL